MSPEEHSEFWRKVEFTVDRDVVRTDRSNSFFRGENNPNVESMRSEPSRTPPSTLLLSASVLLSLCLLVTRAAHRRTYSFYIQNPGEAANEFHALLTLSRLSTFDARSKLMAV